MWKFDAASSLLPVATLACISTSPAHGYEVRRRLGEKGIGEFKGGTIYPLLKRLEEAELLGFKWDTSGKGAARKVYSLTKLGKDTLHSELENLEHLISLMREI
ncbi:PadR family transcriptional regulator [Corynebacterium macginleyi]|uniref:PadR family transcriptional regulator n=1 Tax=Corynebacterium macginleyi TaxID=38290 RepID=A0ABS1Y372_9CORY|nr:PadR family transcriptional regulator [Corynebacterium macginleyi]MBK4166639.1 PadR family transcriptional regulator [Corynebacterium macginleyi]MBK4174374.1 PadR family transcriptional regulator [Corynebacterium macginleyi]MBM0242841.1 PadR family transcriptional regulator [Corynebacterium macginleyi]QRJ57959.1 PadR family transcriptional regulator [Corynebacterium macginleyi]